MLKQIPWYKRGVSETLTDLRYQALDDSERGQLSHLELMYWRHGFLPSDDAQLSRPPYCTGRISPKVIEFFSRDRTGKKLIHKDLQKQRAEYFEKCRKNTDNGKKGGRRKKTQQVSENRSVSVQEASGSSSDSQNRPEEKREEKREEKSLAHAVSSRSRVPENAGATPSTLLLKKAIGKVAEQRDPAFGSGKTKKELDERRRLLLDQADQIKRKHA